MIDLMIVGAGPVGLMCAHLARLCGLTSIVVDKSSGPLEVGRADALNARTLQLFELANLFDELYPQGKICNTSSVWSKGEFISRQSTWWDKLEGCFHKHFLMIGQSFVEKSLDHKHNDLVKRNTTVEDIKLNDEGCLTTLSNGETIKSRYVIGADGSRSFVRNLFKIPFQIEHPQIVWAVIDGVIDTDFKKVPEIIVFQNETSDVAWIPREGEIDRFYVRMDRKDFTQEEVIAKISLAIQPHSLSFSKIVWFSQFSVKESVAEKFFLNDRVFLAGDACHIHSVNGGQGLNTGLGDAFNLIWKINMVENFGMPPELLQSYEEERMPVAKSVIESSGELVRSTKFSASGTHALDYVSIVQKRAGNVTGMGIRYEGEGLKGQRVFDLELLGTRLYSLLDYTKFSLLVFSKQKPDLNVPVFINVIHIDSDTVPSPYKGLAILVRPDSYIESSVPIEEAESLLIPLKNRNPLLIT